jgi:hypothetical protein
MTAKSTPLKPKFIGAATRSTAPQERLLQDELDALGQIRDYAGGLLRPHLFEAFPDQDYTDEGEHVTSRIGEERDSARHSEEGAADGRPDEAGRCGPAFVARHCVGQLSERHDVAQRRRLGGAEDDVGDRLDKRGHDDQRQRNVVREYKQPEADERDDPDGIAGQHGGAPVDLVNEHAGRQSDSRLGDRGDRTDQSGHDRRTGERQHQQWKRQIGHR